MLKIIGTLGSVRQESISDQLRNHLSEADIAAKQNITDRRKDESDPLANRYKSDTVVISTQAVVKFWEQKGVKLSPIINGNDNAEESGSKLSKPLDAAPLKNADAKDSEAAEGLDQADPLADLKKELQKARERLEEAQKKLQEAMAEMERAADGPEKNAAAVKVQAAQLEVSAALAQVEEITEQIVEAMKAKA